MSMTTFTVMPEAFVLRRFVWQLFVTLTFRRECAREANRKSMLFAWLRGLSRSCGIHFKHRLLWFARYERGRSGTGHYHLCVAGLPSQFVQPECCRAYESLWRTKGGGFAQIESYDPARDGVGYILKRPFSEFNSVSGAFFRNDADDYLPTLSDSLIEAMRRGPM
jgi:hypothetical protein